MSPDLPDLLDRFRRHVVVARKQWRLVQLLRESSPIGLGEQIGVFARPAPGLYDGVMRGLMDSTFLQLARLGDSATDSAGHECLSIERVWQECQPLISEDLLEPVQIAMERAKSHLRTGEFKVFRDQVMAHNDLSALGNTPDEDLGISFDVVGDAVTLVFKFQSLLDQAFETGLRDDLRAPHGIDYDEPIATCRRELVELLEMVALGRAASGSQHL